MEVTVVDGIGLPHGTYVSVRAGEVRRQSHFKPGEVFKFDLRGSPKHCVIDVFQKVGTKQIRISDVKEGLLDERIECLGKSGQALGINCIVSADAGKILEPKQSQKSRGLTYDSAAAKAKEYLEAFSISTILQNLVHELLADKPSDPVAYMQKYMSEVKPREANWKAASPDRTGDSVPPSPAASQEKAPPPLPPPVPASPAKQQEMPKESIAKEVPPPPPVPASPARQQEVTKEEELLGQASADGRVPGAIRDMKASGTLGRASADGRVPGALRDLKAGQAASTPLPRGAKFAAAPPKPKQQPRRAPARSPEVPGFGEDGVGTLPDLSRHHSALASVLKERPSAYDACSSKVTRLGVNLAACIRTGIDNRGHRMLKTAGAVAGDEHCFSVFKEIFDPVIEMLHGKSPASTTHKQDLDVAKVTKAEIDPAGGHALGVFVRGSRSLQGMRMPPAMDHDERLEAERLIVGALLDLAGDLQGEYFPLGSGCSFAPGGITEERASALRRFDLMVEEPDAPVHISAGLAREWPEARGVFVNADYTLAAWVNSMEHLELVSRLGGSNVREAFGRFVRAERAVGAALKESGFTFASDQKLGFLNASLSNIGTALHVVVVLLLPHLGVHDDFRPLCKKLGVILRRSAPDTWEVASAERFGCTEVEQVNALIEAARTLVELEQRLQAGDAPPELLKVATQSRRLCTPVSKAPPAGFAEVPGLGASDAPGFPADHCPVALPKLDGHHSITAHILKQEPHIYSKLRTRRTASGVCLARCIKPAIDAKGEQALRSSGIVAGDASCYEVFKELFEPVIKIRHDDFLLAEGGCHPTALSASQLSAASIDATGDQLLAVRLSASRNVEGMCFPPAMSVDERLELERMAFQAMESLDGEYLPLHTSHSSPYLPSGMDVGRHATLAQSGLMLEPPETPNALASGSGRDWPEGRGIFADPGHSLAVWVNGEDHLTFNLTQRGTSGVREIFENFCRTCRKVEAGLQDQGRAFARSRQLGFLTSDPANLGTGGLRVGLVMRLTQLSAHPSFKEVQQQTGVHATAEESREWGQVWHIAKAARLGQSEVELMEEIAAAGRLFVQAEQSLKRGGLEGVGSPAQALITRQTSLAAGELFRNATGLGDAAALGFPEDACPGTLPNLVGYHSIAAEVLRQNPSIYDQLKASRTVGGVSLAKCIKPAMDVAGQPMSGATGAVAGDAACYDVFRVLFDPILRLKCGGSLQAPLPVHVGDPDAGRLTNVKTLDASGRYVLAVRLEASRNLSGLRFPPSISREERCEVERLACEAVDNLNGEYLPLLGSQSCGLVPGGMAVDQRAQLAKSGLLFDAPRSAFVKAAGTGRHWPDGRGVFTTAEHNTAVWVNQEDHLRFIAMQQGGIGLQALFSRFCRDLRAVRESLIIAGHDFAKNKDFGYLTSDPAHVGSGGFRATVCMRLPRFSAHACFQRAITAAGLQLELEDSDVAGRVWRLSKVAPLGVSEAAVVDAVASVGKVFADAEQALEMGEEPVVSSFLASCQNSAAKRSLLAETPGLGEAEMPGFPVDACPAALPDLTGRHTVAADVLRRSPAIYSRLRTLRTKGGVSFARCIKASADADCHAMQRCMGAYAGDAACYELFRELFDAMIDRQGLGFKASKGAGHKPDLSTRKVSSNAIDGTGRYLVSARLEVSRNLDGIRFPAAMTLDERSEVERMACQALESVEDSGYFPLLASQSCIAHPDGMSPEQEADLASRGLLFAEPGSRLARAAGLGRHWPQGRGVFTDAAHQLVAWVNNEDHLKFIATQKGGGALRPLLEQLNSLLGRVQDLARQSGQSYAYSSRLGFLTSDPAKVGSGGFTATLLMSLPRFSAHPRFREAQSVAGVQVGTEEASGRGPLWRITKTALLGDSEADVVNDAAAAARFFVAAEQALERGEEPVLSLKGVESVEDAEEEDFSGIPGLGDDDMPGFPTDACPERLPHLDAHKNMTAGLLRENPSIYGGLRDLRTPLGVSLATCIKPGMDVRGHPMIATLGAVAGDAACYTKFKELFNPLIKARHGFGDLEDDVHFIDLDATQVSTEPLDSSGRILLFSKMEASRNLANFRFPPAIDRDERRQVERIVCQALAGLDGEYMPVANSTSCPNAPLGASYEMEAQLHRQGLLFEEPQSKILLSTGIGRHWPDARGVFANEGMSTAVWVNEQDHLKFILSERAGGGLRTLFERFCLVQSIVREGLVGQGCDYAQSERFGYLTSDPSGLGTGGLVFTFYLRLPSLAKDPRFKEVMQAAGVCSVRVNTEEWGEVFKVTRSAKLGLSEVDLAEEAAEAVQFLVRAELALESGRDWQDLESPSIASRSLSRASSR